MIEETVVVTGANGFIASWIVKKLLERGYNVRGAVRSPEDMRKVGHLLELPGAKERLVLYKAELMGEGAYDEVVAGADYVLHTAGAVVMEALEDPQKEILDPAVEGTLSVLRSAASAKTVRRVVYTSSSTAVIFSDRFVSRSEDGVVDESWWSDSEFCKKGEFWYHLGKLQAEQAAFDFAKQAPFDLVTILPCTVIGGMLQPGVNWTSNELIRILSGVDRRDDHLPIPPNTCFVDVEDVALAHILAMENPNAEGRYLAFGQSMNNDQLAALLGKLYPEYTKVLKPDMKGMDEETFMRPSFKFSTEKLKSLGLKFTPVEEAVKKGVETLKQRNLL
uniref:Cinnamyl alcohol dehydrogenase 2 n=1 Tax=Plagiochasma appendiculatum TaxID=157224 RepID=T1SEU9_9MARC|nr:cinnamyl alcohol dehydrogenase 2 [Plagiochasma appendiculatum]